MVFDMGGGTFDVTQQQLFELFIEIYVYIYIGRDGQLVGHVAKLWQSCGKVVKARSPF